jgi:hypothetical protein
MTSKIGDIELRYLNNYYFKHIKNVSKSMRFQFFYKMNTILDLQGYFQTHLLPLLF